MLNVAIIGSLQFTKMLLSKAIIHPHKIKLIIGQKDGSLNNDFFDLTNFCNTNDIRYVRTSNINQKKVLEELKRSKIDIIFCLGWSRRIEESILSSVKYGVIGYHPTELPYNKGRHPIIWSLVLGLKKTGSTFFKMDKNFDTGDIISQEFIDISEKDKAWDLYKNLSKTASIQMAEILGCIVSNELMPLRLNTSENFWRKRTRVDGIIDWRMSTNTVVNLTRALSYPYPSAEYIIRDKYIKIVAVEKLGNHILENVEPGKVVEVNPETSQLIVKCADGCLRVSFDEKEFSVNQLYNLEYL